MATLEAVQFKVEGSLVRGFLYRPLGAGPHPVVVMAHGFGLVKEVTLPRYAEAFAHAGIAALLFDYRGFGDSEGTPRQEVNPWHQIEDYKTAVTFASTVEGLDRERIGLWGTSYSGGHVLVVAATDRRVKCVVSQLPTTSGSRSGARRVTGDKVPALLEAFAEERVRLLRGEAPTLRPLVGDLSTSPLYPSEDARTYYGHAAEEAPNFRNEVTLRSLEYARGYEPGHWARQVSPTPLLMIVAAADHLVPADLALETYQEALEPKHYVLLQGGHFSAYEKDFVAASVEAVRWFQQHL